jgi:magnesium-protoporphyrin O-methyltransferase
VVFTVAPRTPFLMTFFTLGTAFPRADRSPTMIPQDWRHLTRQAGGKVSRVERVSRGFYISECLEYRP